MVNPVVSTDTTSYQTIVLTVDLGATAGEARIRDGEDQATVTVTGAGVPMVYVVPLAGVSALKEACQAVEAWNDKRGGKS